MPLSFHAEESVSSIRLEGSVDIGSASELKALLLEAIAAGKAVKVSMAAVADVDVTAIQLLWAAEREARKAGLNFEIEGQPQAVMNALRQAGFEPFPVAVPLG